MVLTKEYRICMPMTVEEYRIGQLYMIARHSFEQSSNGEGVEVIANEQVNDEINGIGQFTEKRIHLSSHLPYWIQSITPKIFYVTEKAWNYYPYTITEYTCSFIPKFAISIQTRYEDNSGTTENCLGLTPEEQELREVDFMDIAFDEIKPHHYKESEDPKLFKSEKSGRGPLAEGWRDTQKPIMCCYKVVHAKFEVWGLQTKVEDYVQAAIREILLLGHRQAFTWMDEWFNMTIEDVRNYEQEMQAKTNIKIQTRLSPMHKTNSPFSEQGGSRGGSKGPSISDLSLRTGLASLTQIDFVSFTNTREVSGTQVKSALEESESKEGQDSKKSSQPPTPKSSHPGTPKSPKSPSTPSAESKSWFSWS